MDATIFALAVGFVVSALFIIAALCQKAKENYVLEAADLAQKIREQRERRPVRSVPIPEVCLDKVPAGPAIEEIVLSRVAFERGLLVEALKIVNREGKK